MAIYHNKLNEYQINKLNLIENLEIRKSLMSVLSYMMIVNDHKNAEYNEHKLSFLEKDSSKLTISFEKLHKLYKIKHKKVSLQTLKNRIERLIELKLLVVVDKIKKTNMYAFVLNKPCDISQISSDNVSDFSTSEPLDLLANIKAKVPEEKIYGETKDKDSNSNSDELNYEDHIAAERKVCDWSIVCSKVNELFKALRVRSSWIKDQVISKLSKYYHTISAKYLENYITKMITNARQQYYSNWETKVRDKATSNAPKLRFNNFESRTYDYTILENKLLGWDTDTSNTYLLNGYN